MAESKSFFDAIFGRLFALGTELQLRTGINFLAPLTVAADEANDRYDIGLNSILTGLTSINGARVIAPTQGASIGDANTTLNLSAGAHYYMPAGTTTTARTMTLGNTGVGAAPNNLGEIWVAIYTQGHNVIFNNNSAAALLTLTASSSARVLVFRYDHATTNYIFVGWRPIS